MATIWRAVTWSGWVRVALGAVEPYEIVLAVGLDDALHPVLLTIGVSCDVIAVLGPQVPVGGGRLPHAARVLGDALHVQGGYPRGGEREDVPIGVEAPPVPDERAFPGARLAGEEHGAARVVQRPERVRVVMVSAFIHAGAYASDGPGGTRYASPGSGMRGVCIR